jgi:Alginate export
VEDNSLGAGKVSAYVALYLRDNVSYLDASGNEQRNILDIRYSGAKNGVDWDLEAMGQTGDVGKSRVQAWAIGTRTGYTFSRVLWEPRLGIQIDLASGDHHPGDGFVQTFNPLFPNGYYFTLAGYTSYANLINIKPSITITPIPALTLLAAFGLQWRETTSDGIYTQPNIYVPGTAGEGGSWTGAYLQTRADWTISRNLSASVEAVHFQAGDAIRNAGGHNADYCGVELDYGW